MIRMLLSVAVGLAGCATLPHVPPVTICDVWSGKVAEGREIEVEGYLYTNWSFIAAASPECPQALLTLVDSEADADQRDHAWGTVLSVRDTPSKAVRVRLVGRAIVGGDPAVNALSVTSYRDVSVVEKPAALAPWR